MDNGNVMGEYTEGSRTGEGRKIWRGVEGQLGASAEHRDKRLA